MKWITYRGNIGTNKQVRVTRISKDFVGIYFKIEDSLFGSQWLPLALLRDVLDTNFVEDVKNAADNVVPVSVAALSELV